MKTAMRTNKKTSTASVIILKVWVCRFYNIYDNSSNDVFFILILPMSAICWFVRYIVAKLDFSENIRIFKWVHLHNNLMYREVIGTNGKLWVPNINVTCWQNLIMKATTLILNILKWSHIIFLTLWPKHVQLLKSNSDIFLVIKVQVSHMKQPWSKWAQRFYIGSWFIQSSWKFVRNVQIGSHMNIDPIYMYSPITVYMLKMVHLPFDIHSSGLDIAAHILIVFFLFFIKICMKYFCVQKKTKTIPYKFRTN